jgi:hypothetical protein
VRTLLLLVLLALVAAAVVAWWRSRSRRPATTVAADPLADAGRPGSDPRTIKVGDVVAHGGMQYVVRGTIELVEGGFRWHEHLLDDVRVKRWLAVEEDEQLELTLYRAVDAPDLAPGPSSLSFDGSVWTRTEHGAAGYTATGTTGTGPAGRVEYYDYASGDRRLAFERWGEGGWEVSLGEVVPAASVELYPGSTR